jgi:PAS domain S-box-containing protein
MTVTAPLPPTPSDDQLRLAGIIDAAMDAVITIDSDHNVVLFNPSAERIFRVPAWEVLGQPLDRFIPLQYRQAHRGQVHRFGETGVANRQMGTISRLQGLRGDGEEFPIEASISQVTVGGKKLFTVILRDVSDRNELEARFLRAQRLESVGTLVSGIAHDLNNVLTPILMAMRLLKKNKPGIDREALLDTAVASVERGSAMIRQLLSFAGGLEGERVPIDLNVVVGEVRGILEHSLPKSIAIETELPDGLWPITGDATQLSQVLMNLGVNARDAMPQGGMLRISAVNKSFGTEIARLFPDGKPGPYVVLSVSDTGTGIPPDVLERIFDPFFTTKPFGSGSGLGLSTVLGIAKSHGGFVNVYSEVGHGTRMTVYWPASIDRNAPHSTTGPDEEYEGHGELILIVDDEPLILLTTKATLETSGYRVLTANGGQAGLDTFRAQHGEIAAVLLDMMMPGMDGPTAMRAIKAIDPAVKIIAASGLRLAERPAEALAAGAITFLKKPFSDSELLKTLAENLHAR